MDKVAEFVVMFEDAKFSSELPGTNQRAGR